MNTPRPIFTLAILMTFVCSLLAQPIPPTVTPFKKTTTKVTSTPKQLSQPAATPMLIVRTLVPARTNAQITVAPFYANMVLEHARDFKVWTSVTNLVTNTVTVFTSGTDFYRTSVVMLSVAVKWDALTNSGVSYTVYAGNASRSYQQMFDNLTTNSVTVILVNPSLTNFMAVRARDTNGLQTDFSNEAQAIIQRSNLKIK